MANYTVEEKAAAIRDYDRIDNVTKTASKHDITRQTLYNWLNDRDRILEEAQKSQELINIKDSDIVRADVLEGIETYTQLLEEKGTLEQRKKFLANKTEHLVFMLVHLIENNPELSDMSPDRQAKVLKEVNDIKKDALGEPDMVIEYRNDWMELVLRVLADGFLDNEQLKRFVQRIEQVEEAEYEML